MTSDTKEIFSKFEKETLLTKIVSDKTVTVQAGDTLDKVGIVSITMLNQLKSSISQKEQELQLDSKNRLIRIKELEQENQQLKKEIERLNKDRQFEAGLCDKIEKQAYTLEESVIILRKQNQELKEFFCKKFSKTINIIKKRNPYPSDVFIEPTKKQYEIFNKKLEEVGLTPDGYNGTTSRKVWNNCCDDIMKELNSLVEGGK
jgi:DNA repair exonuclease SbcCD ATPase subunit